MAALSLPRDASEHPESAFPAASAVRAARWSPAATAGRLVELSGPARLSMAFHLILAAQQLREPVAFVAATPSLFFPPDARDGGIDLEALVCVRVAGAGAAARAADLLLRSGAFGLVVLDLDDDHELPMALQSRLVGLAQKHEAAIVCLTEKAATSASLSSLVSLRAEAWRGPAARDEHGTTAGSWTCGVRALKDKRCGPGWDHAEVLRGPPGLR
jgi:recombination protein RecA